VAIIQLLISLRHIDAQSAVLDLSYLVAARCEGPPSVAFATSKHTALHTQTRTGIMPNSPPHE
jgi:hypothetical protein